MPFAKGSKPSALGKRKSDAGGKSSAKRLRMDPGVKTPAKTAEKTPGKTPAKKRTPRRKSKSQVKKEELNRLFEVAKKKIERIRKREGKPPVELKQGWKLSRKGRKSREKKRVCANRDGKRDDGAANRDDADSSEEDVEELHGSTHKNDELNLWSPLTMELAFYSVLEDRKKSLRRRIGVRGIAAYYKVPKTTLNNRVTGKVGGFKHMSGGENQLFSDAEELELANCITKHSTSGFGFTPIQIRQLGYEFAAEVIKRPDDVDKDLLSKNWLRRFLNRYPHLSSRMPQQMSRYRATCANRNTIFTWFGFVRDLFDRYGIVEAACVWNVDETGLMDIPKPRRIIAPKKLKANQIVPKERGETTTAVVMVNAAGQKVPPMIIHKGRKVQQAWKENSNQALVRASPSGWINKDLFWEFGNHFIEFLKTTGLDNKRHVVFLDGHMSHTYNIKFLHMMTQNQITVVCLPAHTSHFLQPLDGVPLAILKSQWQVELHYWNRKKAGMAINKGEWFLLFNRAWRKLSPAVIVKGFSQTGIWPLRPEMISEDKFAPSDLLCPPRPLPAMEDDEVGGPPGVPAAAVLAPVSPVRPENTSTASCKLTKHLVWCYSCASSSSYTSALFKW